jgi:hypothetical protein
MHSDFHRRRTIALLYSHDAAGRAPAIRSSCSRLARLARLFAMAAPAVCINIVIPTPPRLSPEPGIGPWRVEVCTATSDPACSQLHTLASQHPRCQ